MYPQQQDSDEAFRRYAAEQLDRQTRALNRIADNTGVVKALAIVLLVIIGLWVLISIIFAGTAGFR